MSTRPEIRLDIIVLDTADIDELARFYADLLGGSVSNDDEDWRTVTMPDGTKIAAQLAPEHTPPQWPDGPPQQVHLDFMVTDIAAAHEHAVQVGARVLHPTEGPEAAKASGFQVYADPAGHPFCLCWDA